MELGQYFEPTVTTTAFTMDISTIQATMTALFRPSCYRRRIPLFSIPPIASFPSAHPKAAGCLCRVCIVFVALYPFPHATLISSDGHQKLVYIARLSMWLRTFCKSLLTSSLSRPIFPIRSRALSPKYPSYFLIGFASPPSTTPSTTL